MCVVSPCAIINSVCTIRPAPARCYGHRYRDDGGGSGEEGGGPSSPTPSGDERDGAGRRAEGGRDFLAERRAELEAMRQEATNRTYGRVKGAAEVRGS